MSSPKSNQTQMVGDRHQSSLVSPPTTETKMGESDEKKLVKIRVKHPIRVMRGASHAEEHIYTEGQTVDVTEEEAAEFCDRPFDLGYKGQYGQIHGPMTPLIRFRAERVK